MSEVEVWKETDYPDYMVSNKGRVLNTKTNRFRKFGINLHGYEYLVIGRGKGVKPKTINVHRLVALAFLEKIEGKGEVNHIDFNRANNNVTNLEWVTHSENMRHSYARFSEARKGSLNGRSKLTENIVSNILHMRNEINMNRMSKIYKVTPTAIWLIINRKSWKHVR